ncbi:GMP synthase [Veronia nyctiphanis]|uniref:GMP synthase n=1 Tax=Veronia nyctiphanis TaxID=1278244 RepID=A0A4Q0YKC6_9GAMM|nr:GMP synthase [Veronia nyctiphanis]RXJ70424.1 GMP synthase [Veronia nyctiphanis]
MKIHFIIHEIFEGPGAFELWAIKRGYQISCSRVYLGESLPTDTNDIDFLIVLGGPQRPNTTIAECPHFDANAEIKVIESFIESQKAVLGVCLGAQLIGEALGANFEESPNKEIGVFPILITPAGKGNVLFSKFNDVSDVGHWHGDMPGLTESSTLIASSEGCPRQIVEYSKLVFGFQCHLEFTPDLIELLIQNSEKELKELENSKFVQSPEELRANNYEEMNRLLFSFLDRLVDKYIATN